MYPGINTRLEKEINIRVINVMENSLNNRRKRQERNHLNYQIEKEVFSEKVNSFDFLGIQYMRCAG